MSHPVVDTNILVRLLTGDGSKEQVEGVKRYFSGIDHGEYSLQLPDVIIAETIYVLESFYKLPRKDICAAISNIISSPRIIVADLEQVLKAFDLYASSKISFADAYVAAVALQSSSEVLSFDKDFDKIDNITRLKP